MVGLWDNYKETGMKWTFAAYSVEADRSRPLFKKIIGFNQVEELKNLPVKNVLRLRLSVEWVTTNNEPLWCHNLDSFDAVWANPILRK